LASNKAVRVTFRQIGVMAVESVSSAYQGALSMRDLLPGWPDAGTLRYFLIQFDHDWERVMGSTFHNRWSRAHRLQD